MAGCAEMRSNFTAYLKTDASLPRYKKAREDSLDRS